MPLSDCGCFHGGIAPRGSVVPKRGLSNFIEVGEALAEIRDARLYRVEHGTFEDYCRKKWGFTRMQASRLIGAAEVCNQLVTDQPPKTESQARPLTKLETPEQQREAWTAAVETSGGKPTAKHVEACGRGGIRYDSVV